LKVFLDRTEIENSIFGSASASTNTGKRGKAHRSLLNDPRIKEIRTLLSTLRIEHPKLSCLIEILKEKMTWHPSLIQTDSDANSNNIVAKRDYFVKAIVFTQYRDTAQHIVDILNSNGIKAARFVDKLLQYNSELAIQEQQHNGSERDDPILA